MVVLLSCVKKKKDGVHKAEELYDSVLFRSSLAYAKALTSDENIFILSAKYGCLTLGETVESYNLTLNEMTDAEIKEWSEMVYQQLLENNVKPTDEVIFLTGKKYRKYLSKLFLHSICPVEHMGIGQRVKYFKEQIKKYE